MIDSLSESYREVIRAIGEDPDREGLLDTPQRAAKAMEFPDIRVPPRPHHSGQQRCVRLR